MVIYSILKIESHCILFLFNLMGGLISRSLIFLFFYISILVSKYAPIVIIFLLYLLQIRLHCCVFFRETNKVYIKS